MKKIMYNTLIASVASFCLTGTALAGGILKVGNGADPTSLDPHYVSINTESNIIDNMFGGLTRPNAKGKIIPGLAKSWDISKDGKTYTFYLRDAKWSDGKPITAHDFEFSFKRILKPETASKYSFMLHPIVGAEDYNRGKGDVNAVGVKALDDKTFQITLNEPVPYLFCLLYTSPSPRDS